MSDPLTAELTVLRDRIDALDDQLLTLLNTRAQVARDVGHLKARHGLSQAYAPVREQSVIARLAAANPGPFPAEGIRAVFQEVMSACLSLEQPLRVAFLGPEGTVCHQATRHRFGLGARALAMATIEGVFQAVEKGHADLGVVPAEHATEGSEEDTLDAFLERDVRVTGEVLLPTAYGLLLPPRVALSQVSRVYSHPQAFAHCRRWLAANLATALRHEVASTAEAARMAKDDPEGAAIATAMAAELFGLRVAREGIQDGHRRTMRFLVLGRTIPPPSGQDRTSLLIQAEDRPGLLCDLLQPFSRARLNLLRVESLLTQDLRWPNAFFLDVAGHPDEPALDAALRALAALGADVRILGSYPRALEAAPTAREGS